MLRNFQLTTSGDFSVDDDTHRSSSVGWERRHHVRKKYGCARCDAEGMNPRIASAEKPAAAIDKGLPGPGLLS